MTDSCFIDDTSSKNYVSYVAQLATSSSCCGCCVYRPSPRTGTNEYVGLELFAWLATSWNVFSRYQMSALLGGHMLAVSV